jgi:serine phosphatase RsbU (regulator of sigma subunit)
MFHIVATMGGRSRVWTLEPGVYRLGRGPENAIVLTQSTVSREHAEFVVAETGVRIRDLGSSNGTWVNGRRITEALEIRPGDRIGLGGLELAFGAGPSPGPAAAPTPGFATRIAFADVGEITAGESLGMEEARSGLRAGSSAAQALLGVVTDAGQLLMAPQPLDEICDRLLDLVEPVVPARRILLLTMDSPEAEPKVCAARPALGAADAKLTLSRTILAAVLGERQALLLNDAPAHPRFGAQESILRQNLRSAMVAPLFDNQRVIGLLYADSDEPGRIFDRDQLRAFTLLAHLIGIKITQTRLLEVEREKQHMEREVAAAVEVQRSMLPATLPEAEGYRLCARQVPCELVAGDLYDATRLEDGSLIFVLGDVCGKGLGAALLMANTIAGLRVLYPEGLSLPELAERIHLELLQSSDATRFVTLFLGRLDPRRHRLEYVNAGHNAPLLITDAAEPRGLAATGLPMGMLRGAHYEVAAVDLPPGALLCVFSDGVPEAEIDEQPYGDDRLVRSLIARRGRPLEEIADGALADLREYLGGCAAGDDVTLLLLRREEVGS